MHSTWYIQINMVSCFGLGDTLGFLHKNLVKGKDKN